MLFVPDGAAARSGVGAVDAGVRDEALHPMVKRAAIARRWMGFMKRRVGEGEGKQEERVLH
jgi:hypothetical protein